MRTVNILQFQNRLTNLYLYIIKNTLSHDLECPCFNYWNVNGAHSENPVCARPFPVSHPTGCLQNTEIPDVFALKSSLPFSSGREPCVPPHAQLLHPWFCWIETSSLDLRPLQMSLNLSEVNTHPLISTHRIKPVFLA